jgi:tetratricopeptide (TPR) repeat protein
MGELETAQSYIENGLKIQRNAELSFGLAYHFRLLSRVHFDSGDLKKAQDCIENALRISQKNNGANFAGLSRSYLGRILGRADPPQSDKAEESILQGIKILDELKIKSYSAQGCLFLGELYVDTGQRQKAWKTSKKAEGMFQEMGLDYRLARTREVLARL